MDSKFFSNNRKKLANQLDSGLVVIAGNLQMQRSGDTAYSFRQDSNMWYLSGIEVAGAILCIDIDSHEEFLIIPIPQGVKAIFDGEVDTRAISGQSGIKKVFNESDGWAYIRSKKPKKIHICMSLPARYDDVAVNPHRAMVLRRLKRVFKNAEFIDVRPALAKLRMIKQPVEITAIETAATITYEALNDLLPKINSYETEAAVEGVITSGFKARGASGHAYSPIVASGAASCTLHYVQNNRQLYPGEPLLLDVGAEYLNYAADISRTIILGDTSTRQRAVIDAVALAQNRIAQNIKPGVTFEQLEDIAVTVVGEQLVDLGLVKDLRDTKAVRSYYPHAVSHFLGLDVHDVGDYSASLQEGMVITVEPGIYIADEALGVRIEDDYLITSDGVRKLGKSLPPVL